MAYNSRMNRIWSPWRMKYIEKNEKEDGCVFCNAQARDDSAANLIAFRGKRAFVILNLYPYTSGHLMVVPFEHLATLEELNPATRAEMMELTSQCMVVLQKNYQPQGFNMGANIGKAAGAGVPGHVHIHIVPRWGGDTNFMTTLGEARVLPELLEDTYKRIREGFASL
jgi:ATP adenylyltransferase